MELHLECGPNRKHKVTPWKTLSEKAICKNVKLHPLSLLLTCKQISKEATGIAYGQLSLTLDTVFRYPRSDTRIPDMLATYAQTFRATTLSHATRMYFRKHAMMDLLNNTFLYAYPLTDSHPASEGCTGRCHKFASHSGDFHTTFHNIRQITIDLHITGNGGGDNTYRLLKAGASWFSFVMQPNSVPRLLGVFPNLEEIVVRRECGKQQLSVVRDGKVFADESGMPLGGRDDWA